MMRLIITASLFFFFAMETAFSAGFKYGGVKYDIASSTTASSTTALTASSSQVQAFTGSSAQTLKLPDATGLSTGYWYTVSNEGTGYVTVQDNGGGNIASMTASQSARFVLKSTASAIGSWDAQVNTPATIVQAMTANDVNWAQADVFTKTLGASSSYTFSNRVVGKTILVVFTNTASNYTVTWPAGIFWSGGSAPTQTTGAKKDVYTFFFDGANTYGNAVQNLF